MMHPDTRVQFISDEVGHGVVATAFIPKGTITWVQDPLDQVFTAHRRASLPAPTQALLEYFAFKNAKNEMILCWDHARYVNHSFKSNCLSTAYDFEVAIRDIRPGEQLTDDYGYLNLDTPWKPLDEGTRRKWVRPDDPVRCARAWDKNIDQAMRHFDSVPQPLAEWVSGEFWADWQLWPAPLKSTVDLLCARLA
ncbi:MAG: SET domain-containing protein [Bacteroidetes bacterium]|nr:SET domain-containing protein [Bacteroidota bacterium]